MQLLRRDDVKDGRPTPHVLSMDYDDLGELLMTSASDETIHIYNVRDGRHDKTLLSKKYGVKLAQFTHTSSSIIYASTKQNREPRPPRRPVAPAENGRQTPSAISPPTTTPSSATSRATRPTSPASPSTRAATTLSRAPGTTRSACGTPRPGTGRAS